MPNCISTRRSSKTALSAGVNLEPNPSPTLSATRLAAGAVPLTLPIGINSVEPSALALSNIDKDVLFALILRIRAEKRVSERLRRGEPLGVVSRSSLEQRSIALSTSVMCFLASWGVGWEICGV